MTMARTLAMLGEELIESLDAAAARRERAARRWLRRVESSLAAAAWRLRIRRLEAELDRLRIAAVHRAANELRRCGLASFGDTTRYSELRGLSEELAAARRRLEETVP